MAGFTIPDNDVAGNTNQSIWFQTDIDIMIAGLNGVGVASGCGVTAQGSPDMTVAIAAGIIRIASGALIAVTSGNGTISTADGTNPRIDLVSSSNAGVKTVTAGTPAANPKPPALPAGHVGLAMVYVAASDTAISSGEITDKRVILPSSPGRLIGLTQYRPGSDTTVGSTTSNTAGDLDATNCIVTFTAPVSTNVLVRLTAVAEISAAQLARWGLRESTTLLAETVAITNPNDGDSTHSAVFLISGIAAGSHTYKFAYRVAGGATHAIIGGPTFGNVVIEVWEAP